jgi:hypothetical protein
MRRLKHTAIAALLISTSPAQLPGQSPPRQSTEHHGSVGVAILGQYFNEGIRPSFELVAHDSQMQLVADITPYNGRFMATAGLRVPVSQEGASFGGGAGMAQGKGLLYAEAAATSRLGRAVNMIIYGRPFYVTAGANGSSGVGAMLAVGLEIHTLPK